MNKENCALKLVDEIILYYDARSKKHQITIRMYFHFSFTMAQPPLSGPKPPHYRGFMLTLRYTHTHTHTHTHTTLGKIPLDEESARRKNLYLTTHITRKRQRSKRLAAFGTLIPASERPLA